MNFLDIFIFMLFSYFLSLIVSLWDSDISVTSYSISKGYRKMIIVLYETRRPLVFHGSNDRKGCWASTTAMSFLRK